MKSKVNMKKKAVSLPPRRMPLWIVCIATGIALLGGGAVFAGKKPLPEPDATAVGGDAMQFKVELDATPNIAIRYDANTSDGTAISGTDYASVSGYVQFNSGDNIAYVSVDTYENSEYTTLTVVQFKLTLDNLKIAGQEPGSWTPAAFAYDIPSKIELIGWIYHGGGGSVVETLGQ